MPSETKKEKLLSTIEGVITMRKDLNKIVSALDDLILELTDKLEQINE